MFEVFCREHCEQVVENRFTKFSRMDHEVVPSLISGIASFLNDGLEATEESELRELTLKLTSNDTDLIEVKASKTDALSKLATLGKHLGRDWGLLDAPMSQQQLEAEMKRSLRSLVHATFKSQFFPTVMGVIWLRLEDSVGKQWKHAVKALQLSKKLVEFGSDRVVCYFRDRLEILQSFVEYQHEDESCRDAVSEQAASLFRMVTDLASLSAMRRVLYPKIVQIKKYFCREAHQEQNEKDSTTKEHFKNIEMSSNFSVFDLAEYIKLRKLKQSLNEITHQIYKQPELIWDSFSPLCFISLHKLLPLGKGTAQYADEKRYPIASEQVIFPSKQISECKEPWTFFESSAASKPVNAPIVGNSGNAFAWEPDFSVSTDSFKAKEAEVDDFFNFPKAIMAPPLPLTSLSTGSSLTVAAITSPNRPDNAIYNPQFAIQAQIMPRYAAYPASCERFKLAAVAAPTAKSLSLSGRSNVSQGFDPFASLIQEIKRK